MRNIQDSYERRANEFPEKIRRLAMNNSIVRRVFDMYVHEQILTKEEALLQMVVHLAEMSDEQMKRNIELYKNLPMSPHIMSDLHEKLK